MWIWKCLHLQHSTAVRSIFFHICWGQGWGSRIDHKATNSQPNINLPNKKMCSILFSAFHLCNIPTTTYNNLRAYLKHSPLQVFSISIFIMIIYRNWILCVYHLLHGIRMMHFLSWWWMLCSMYMYFKDSWQLFQIQMLRLLTHHQNSVYQCH